jgi:hypothetical protein
MVMMPIPSGQLPGRGTGERLICCRNPALAAQRESLLAATEKELEKTAAQVAAGRLKGADKIGVKVGKVINKRKAGKHFITDIADGRLSWRRDQDKSPPRRNWTGSTSSAPASPPGNSGPPGPPKPTKT